MEVVTCTVGDACKALGIGKTKLYEIMPELRTIKVGRRTLVTTQSIREFVAQREAA